MLNLFIPGDWHEFQIAASQENLATLLAPRYKRLQFQLPRTSPRVWGRGVMVGLGEGAKRDASAFLKHTKPRNEFSDHAIRL